MTAIRSFNSRQRGFSLIDAMIAAVVLATGLLALAALQANITRNTADARARSQIVAFVEEIVERQRAYGVNASFNDVPVASLWTAAEVTAAQNAAGVSGLTLALTSTHFDGRTGTFVTPVAAGLKTSDPQYKILRSVATWNDVSGQARRLDMTSVLSPRVTSSSRLPYDSATSGSNLTTASPVVRTTTPVTAGMIPIAIGGSGDETTETAATNPKPVISAGQNRTSFEVLTYTNTDGDLVTQQRRVETAVINCTCASGTAPDADDPLRQYAQWPAYWSGTRYSIYAPTTNTDPPGTAAGTGAKTGVSQDTLCTECCRDHHGTSGSTHVKFDPFRTDAHDHYKMVNGALVKAGSGDDYLESCRMIRVDGFWRTAQDMDLKHFGLMETSDYATSPVPSSSAATNYQTFAKAYLDANYVPDSTPATADALYEANGLNAPSTITISKPTPKDERYLHTRGLYVDNVEPSLQTKIQKAYDTCPSGKAKEECVLPLLAFTSINLTEASYYSAEPSTGSVTVDTDGFVEFDPALPNRGRVNAISTAPASPAPVVSPRITKSNSGIAVVDKGIDPEDDVDLTDAQEFTIQGTGSTGSGRFNVALSGLPASSKSPAVAWSNSGSGNNCQGPSPYACITSFSLPVDLRVSVSAYNQQVDRKETVNVTCQDDVVYSYVPKGQETSRFCRNYRVSSVVAPSGSTASNPDAGILRSGNIGNSATGSNSEATFVDLTSVPEGSTTTINFSYENEKIAPLTCVFKITNQGQSLSGVTWNDCSTGE